jgi:hypothetical protein
MSIVSKSLVPSERNHGIGKVPKYLYPFIFTHIIVYIDRYSIAKLLQINHNSFPSPIQHGVYVEINRYQKVCPTPFRAEECEKNRTEEQCHNQDPLCL